MVFELPMLFSLHTTFLYFTSLKVRYCFTNYFRPSFLVTSAVWLSPQESQELHIRFRLKFGRLYMRTFHLVFCSTYITFFLLFYSSTYDNIYILQLILYYALYETDSRRYWWKILHFNKNQISYHISKAFLNYVSEKKKSFDKKSLFIVIKFKIFSLLIPNFLLYFR